MGCASAIAKIPVSKAGRKNHNRHFGHSEEILTKEEHISAMTIEHEQNTNIDDGEFDQIPQILFEGVSSLKTIGCPGTLIPVTNQTRAVICGADSNNVIAAASLLGRGRCLVFAHSGYPYMFINVDVEDRRFVENCRLWLAKGRNAQFVLIDDTQSLSDVPLDETILVWNGECIKNDTFMQNLHDYLRQGGALVCGATPWGWLQLNSGKILSDLPFFHFCDFIGIKLTENYSNCSNPMPFQLELIQFKNIHHATQKLVADPTDIESLCIVGGACKDLNVDVSGLPIDILKNIAMKAENEVIPSNSCPIQDKCCRQKSNGLCGILCVLTSTKAPGIANFPGDFSHPPVTETHVIFHIESNANEWYCTGYYAVAGIPIQIDVLECMGAMGWSIRIGCHSDHLENCEELRRWSCISINKPLVGNSIQMSSAFGGLIFLQSPNGESNSITVRLHHVVLTLTYDSMDPNRVANWQHRRHHARGLWADIAGQHIVLNLPSKSLRHLKSTQLDEVLLFWDSVVLAHHELRGTKPKHRERIVCDEQPSAGYMHSGYPIVTHMDVTDPQSDKFLFNIHVLKKKGWWGVFHELGHNMQRDWWTFDGTGEVTVNIFTLHAMNIICHIQPWIHPWLEEQESNTRIYIENGCNFDEWKDDPGIGLIIYAQLAREYGWETYKQVFRQYEQTQPYLDSNQEKMDHWIEIFSRQVGYNLIPLFKFWGFPVSKSTVEVLHGLDVPKITDKFIEIAPERYRI
ncbi:unnamed protein product [Rotaria socialis]|uniref:Peptidase M60 domain-containing protein n=1 Tax=Rotaria socialis TaxID=392032 RepID=A0A820XQT8_9BILA|nr:unnamed protein product [Rotaria socialis]CAF3471717.1 unnamed protein product [Rotaria socialis]CAF4535273.1 unnamed protein product [Rotaria socialis]